MSRAWPPVRDVRWDDTHRLILDAYAARSEPILAGLAGGDADDAHQLAALAGATSRRALAQQGRIPAGIHGDELVHGVPEWQVVNAAYCYPNPLGGRFNGADRGAWYAGRSLDTSIAEVVFHKTVELAETGWWQLTVDYRDFLADLHGNFHDLRGPQTARARRCLEPGSYRESQRLAEELLARGSLGVVYPSVRHAGGEVIACFRPAAVSHVRRGGRVRLTWNGSPAPSVRQLR